MRERRAQPEGFPVTHRQSGSSQFPQMQPTAAQPPHQQQQVPQLQSFLATAGPVAAGTACQPADREEYLRDACKAHDLTSACIFVSTLSEDDQQQILPNVFDDLFQTLQDVASNETEEGKVRSVTADQLADLAFQLGQLQLQPGQQAALQRVMQAIADIAKYKTDELQSRGLSRIVWGFAGAAARNDSLMSVVAAEVVNKIRGFNHEELARTAWAFAKCGLWNEQLATCLTRECMDKIEYFTPESLSSLSWALAQWGTHEEQLLSAIAQALLRQKDNFEPANMAMVTWALSTLKYKNEPLMKAITCESISQMSLFTNQDLAHIAWAFSNLRVQDRNFYLAISHQVQRNAAMQPSEIANVAWAFAKNHMADQPVMRLLADQAEPQIGSFKAAEITMLTWAFAVAGQPHVGLLSEIGSKVAKRAEKFSASQLAHVTWAFGALSLRQADLCERVARVFEQNQNTFTAQGLTQIVWGFARVKYRDRCFMDAAASHIINGISDLKPLALWRCVWAYNTLLVSNAGLRKAILVEAAKPKKLNEFSLKGLARLVESCKVGHKTSEQQCLEESLKQRLVPAAQGLESLFPDFNSLHDGNQEAFSSLQNQNIGTSDLPACATKLILDELAFGTPPWSFISRCLQEVHGRRIADGVFIDVEVEVLQDMASKGELKKTILRPLGEANPEDESMKAQRLLVANVFGSTVESEALFLALSDACASIYTTLRLTPTERHCQAVCGSLRILLSQVPSFSSISLLLQMRRRFPNVRVEFVEMQLAAPANPSKSVGLETY